MVLGAGLEPAWPFSLQILSLVCLPISSPEPRLQYTRCMLQPEHKKQIFIIHGGDSFASYEAYLANLKQSSIEYDRLKPSRRWKDSLAEAFPEADILTPTMPNSANAQFDEWKIVFEKLIPFFGDDVRLIGHSLGAMFLANYLHTHPLKQPVAQLILLAGGYNEEGEDYGQFRVSSARGLEKSAQSIHLMHSADDPVVRFEALEKYVHDLPSAIVHRFADKNHFLDESFPELIQILK